MDKLAWVLLPLVTLLGWLGWRALRGRLPTRLALNVASSVLLLAYLAITAGLGIFWVAHQHLPVFDWHYLFGYATVLLVAVHLAFNFRVVWQHWRRAPMPPGHSRAPSPAAASTPSPAVAQVPGTLPRGLPLTRRPVSGALLALGFAASTGGAFWLGLRHGRTEIAVSGGPAQGPASQAPPSTPQAGASAQTPGTASAAAETAWAVVLAFHEFSSHSRLSVFRRAPGTQWGNAPPPFLQPPPEARVLPLPAPWRSHAELPAVVSADAAALGTLLWHTAGISLRRGGIGFRSAPSSGALFSTELTLLTGGAGGPLRGLHRYAPDGHALVALPGAPPALPAGALAAVVATAVFRRSGHKYGDRTYRYVLCDLGHALENLRAAARALGWQATLLPAFDEAALAARLSLADEAEEGVLAVALLYPEHSDAAAYPVPRAAGSADTGAPMPAAQRPPAEGQPAVWQPAALPEAAAMGVTTAVHRATSLRQRDPAAPLLRADLWPGVQPWRQAEAHAGPGGPRIALPPPRPRPADTLALIARRRSRRRYAGGALPLQALSDLLAAAAAAPVLSAALRLAVVTPAVQGLAARAWHLDPARHALQAVVADTAAAAAATAAAAADAAAVPGLRQRMRSAGLGQDVVGDAAALLVVAVERAAIGLDPHGAARGYRHAFLEAGLAGERAYLAAEALGLGLCAVGAFYDDETAQLAGFDPASHWVVHLACIGLPA